MNIRQAAGDDFDIVMQCVKDAYGMSYCRQEIYCEDIFREKISNGELTVFLIERSAGKEVAGMIGYVLPVFCEKVYELGMLIVRQKYRCNGFAMAIINHAMEKLRQTEKPVSYATIDTSHLAAQKLAESGNYICTGFLFNATHEKEDIPNKESLTFHTMKMAKQSAETLYLPDCLVRTAEYVYDGIGVEYDIKTSGHKPEGITALEHYFDKSQNTLYINIAECGYDLTEKISELECEYNRSDLFSVILYLNIKSAASIDACNRLREKQYFFSGFKPLYYDLDYMILCKPDGKINTDELVLTEGAQNLLREVMKLENR